MTVQALPRAAGLLFLGALAAACGDPATTAATSATSQSATSQSSAAPSASASTSGAATASGEPGASASATAAAPSPSDEVDPGAIAVEPERKTLRSAADDPALYANRDFLADHYGVVNLPFPLQLQAVALPHARRALLFTGQGPALDKPLILVVEADHHIAWSKPRPLAGTRERAKELTLTRGSRGEVLLFWYDEPTKIFAARMWTHDGGIFADFDVLSADDCDGASVLFWPGQGWVAAVLHGGTLHAQLLSEAHGRRWDGNGIDLAPPTGAAAKPGRPKIAVRDEHTVEIGIGSRKVKISDDGVLTK